MLKTSFSINYNDLGTLDLEYLKVEGLSVDLYLDTSKPETFLTTLFVRGGELVHMQTYVSPLEFATIETKQVLVLYVKRKVISLDPAYYTKDDPKLHGFISKLSYEGIKYVAEHVVEFADAFKHNKVKETLNIPKPVKKYRG